MVIKPIFAWYNLWVGFFWDQNKKRLTVSHSPASG